MSEPIEPLSERELEILKLVATGAANKEIARQLLISPNTVKVHLRNIFGKIGVASRTEATLYAIQIGLIQPLPQETPGGNGAQAAPVEQSLLEETAAQRLAGGQAAEPAPAPPLPLRVLRQLSRGQLAGLALLALLLVAAGVLAARWMLPPAQAAQPTVQALSTPAPANRWTVKSSLPDARKSMGAVEYENAFYLIGGETGAGPTGSLLRYQPLTDQWQQLAAKPVAVSEVQAGQLGEKIYVPGGRLADGSQTTVFEVYDPREDSWQQLSPLPVAISGYALAAFEGRLYLFGGQSGAHILDSVYSYAPDEDRWQPRTPLEHAAAFSGATVVGNKIFLIGGYDGQTALTTNTAYYPSRDDNGENPWERYAPLPAGRYAMAISSLSNVIYIAGGLPAAGGAANPITLQYQSQTDQWAAFEAPDDPLGAHGVMLAADGYLHFLGGENEQHLSAEHQAYQALYSISLPLITTDK